MSDEALVDDSGYLVGIGDCSFLSSDVCGRSRNETTLRVFHSPEYVQKMVCGEDPFMIFGTDQCEPRTSGARAARALQALATPTTRQHHPTMKTRDAIRRTPTQSRGKDWALILGVIATDRAAALPPYVQVGRAIAEAIRSGRLVSGDRLPGTRTLAVALGLHRNTILKAYGELLSEGWLEVANAKGTFVASNIPSEQVPKGRGKRAAHFDLPASGLERVTFDPPISGELQMNGGTADLRLLPTTAIARAFRRALRHAPRLLTYGDPQGNLALRSELSKYLGASRGLSVAPEDMLVTRGSQMALFLAASVILRRGDTVVVESLGYPAAWQALKSTGARLVACNVDGAGLDTERLSELCERFRREGKPVRAIYLTPHHQFPSTVALTPGRRMRLRQLAEEYRFWIFEDDYDHEFQYEGQPLLPLASSFSSEGMVYVGTLSKVLAPGLRLGFLVAPSELIERAAAHRFYIDRQGDAATEVALAELIEDGEVQRHIRKMRWIYQERRDHCVQLLHRHFGEQLEFRIPTGGMALWVRCARPIVGRWAEASQRLGVRFQTGRTFAMHPRSDDYLRLGYAGLDLREMEQAVTRLATAWGQVCTQS